MNFTIELTASPTLLEAINILVTALTGQPTNSTAAVKESTKKVKMPSAAPVVTQAENMTSVSEETATEEEASNFTLEQVRAAAQAKSQEGKREEVRALVTEFGAANLPSLDPTRFNDFMSKLKSL